MDGITRGNLKELIEGLIDEDERDEDGKDFLGEAGNVSDQEAALHRHNDNHNQYQPHTHPYAAYNVLNALHLAELLRKEQREGIL